MQYCTVQQCNVQFRSLRNNVDNVDCVEYVERAWVCSTEHTSTWFGGCCTTGESGRYLWTPQLSLHRSSHQDIILHSSLTSVPLFHHPVSQPYTWRWYSTVQYSTVQQWEMQYCTVQQCSTIDIRLHSCQGAQGPLPGPPGPRRPPQHYISYPNNNLSYL